jgi:hypothetical protein
MRITGTRALLAFVLSLMLLTAAGGTLAQEPLNPELVESVGAEDSGPTLSGVELSAAVSLLLPYQGRLTVPSTRQPAADGDYTMVFSLYTVDVGGSALWTETKTVSVVGGLFSTNLGDATPLNQNQLNGQALWLDIKVGADAEAAPRIPILPVAYAASVVPGASIKGSLTGSLLNVSNIGTGSGSNGMFVITSSTASGASAVRGQAGSSGYNPANIVGVTGESSTGYGVFGISSSSIGVYGYSGSYYGVYGAGMGAQPGVFGGNWGSGYGAHFYKPGGTAIYAQGSVTVTENLKVNGTVSGANTSLPIAYANIYSSGSKASGSANVSSTWDSTYSRYSITISGVSYSVYSYVTLVTTIGSGCLGYTPRTDSVSGNLLVYFINESGSKAQCPFQFVTYQP